MKILALDQSTSCTGWTIAIDGKVNEDNVGLIKSHSKDYIERIKDTVEKVAQLIKDNDINLVVFEDIQMQGYQVDVFKKLAQLQGSLMFMLLELGVSFEILHTARWRKELGMSGKGVKRQEWKLRSKYYAESQELRYFTEDENDSICIAFAAMELFDSVEVPKFDAEGFESYLTKYKEGAF